MVAHGNGTNAGTYRIYHVINNNDQESQDGNREANLAQVLGLDDHVNNVQLSEDDSCGLKEGEALCFLKNRDDGKFGITTYHAER